jgi:hypothetical protein
LLAVIVLAAAGQALLIATEFQYDQAHGVVDHGLPLRTDFADTLNAADALVHGRPAYPWYGDDHLLGYAPPYVAVFAPFGLLPREVGLVLSWLVAVALVAAVVVGWARASGATALWALPFLVSIPVISLVRLDQLNSAVGLAALSLAIWAQRRDRWFLVGCAAAFGLARTSNAIPIIAMLAVTGIGRPRELATAALGLLSLVVPAGLLAFIWDPHWVADYAHNLSIYPLSGPVKLFEVIFGSRGPVLLEVLVTLAAGWLAWPCRGRKLDLDRAALGLALSVVAAIVSTYYCAVFALPALIRLARRHGYAAVRWMVAAGPWIVVLLLAPLLLSPDSGGIGGVINIMVLVLVLATYPLLRRATPVPERGSR